MNSVFDHWEGGASGTANPVNVVVNGNTAVRAVFAPRFTVTVTVEGSGSVDPNGGTFNGGSQINLTATPTGQVTNEIPVALSARTICIQNPFGGFQESKRPSRRPRVVHVCTQEFM